MNLFSKNGTKHPFMTIAVLLLRIVQRIVLKSIFQLQKNEKKQPEKLILVPKLTNNLILCDSSCWWKLEQG